MVARTKGAAANTIAADYSHASQNVGMTATRSRQRQRQPQQPTRRKGVWSGRLRQRGPARRDKELVAIYEGLGGCEELLRRVALLAVTAPPRYRLRSSVRKGKRVQG
jgi:hypothetical protein